MHYEYRALLENALFQLLISETTQIDSIDSCLHSHVSAELFVCVEGEIVIGMQQNEIVLRQNDIVIIPPGSPHKNHIIKDGAGGFIFNFLCTKQKNDSCTDLFGMLSPFTEGKDFFIYRDRPALTKSITEIVAESKKCVPLLTAAKTAVLLSDLAKQGSEGSGILQENKPSRIRDIQFMMKLDRIISESYDQNVSITDIAKLLYISPRQLDRIIQKRYGKTLHSVFMDKRIHAAEHYLSATDISVDKIAITVGFNSSGGLYREFEKRHGITPTQYRKKLNGL